MKKSLSILNLFRNKETITVHKTIKKELLIEKYEIKPISIEEIRDFMFGKSFFDNMK